MNTSIFNGLKIFIFLANILNILYSYQSQLYNGNKNAYLESKLDWKLGAPEVTQRVKYFRSLNWKQ
jgi:hypothetical protein